jgi:hypothetical protein
VTTPATLPNPLRANIISAGDIQERIDEGDETIPVSCGLVLQFKDPADLQRALNGEPIVAKWAWEWKEEKATNKGDQT